MNSFDDLRGDLIYENPLSCADDLRDFILEGKALTRFPNGRLPKARSWARKPTMCFGAERLFQRICC